MSREKQARVDYHVSPATGALQGRVRVPGDKSISHRAVILASLAEGTSVCDGFLDSADTRATMVAFRQMGVDMTLEGECLSVNGVGLNGLSAPSGVLDLGNSGTSARLLLGVLAGQRFSSVLSGDESLTRRPMQRVADPLNTMNADVRTTPEGTLPARITGNRRLRGIDYELPVASAQLKSALLLAGLYAQGKTVLTEPAPTRDHTERMLAHFGCPVTRSGMRITMQGNSLRAGRLRIPGDISSAAFFLAAGSIVPGSDLVIQGVGINPTRHAVIEILNRMGADISVSNLDEGSAEPVADLRVKYRPLHGIRIPRELVPIAIDEFPAIMMAACHARGETVLEGAAELRVKESDRIQALAEGLEVIGCPVETRPDGMRVTGGRPAGGVVRSHGDHRIAMAFSVAGLAAEGPVTVQDCNNVDTSFPGFIDCARQLGWEIQTSATENTEDSLPSVAEKQWPDPRS